MLPALLAVVILCAAPAGAGAPAAGPPAAAPPAAAARLDHGRALYEQHCIGCHKKRGSATGGAEYPQLGGQQRQYLLEQLQHFAALERWSPTMHRVLQSADLANPQALADIADYLAHEPRETHGEHGDPMGIGHGKRLYEDTCAFCHGSLGEGRPQGPIPAIGGQNFTYLVIQLNGFAAGHRARVESSVLAAMTHMSKDDISAVADYISRLPDSASRLNIP